MLSHDSEVVVVHSAVNSQKKACTAPAKRILHSLLVMPYPRDRWMLVC